MSAAEDFLDAVTERVRELDRDDATLAGARQASVAALRDGGIPTGKLETWKYTAIAPFFAAPFGANGAATATAAETWFDFADATQIELRDGRLIDTPTLSGLEFAALGGASDALNDRIDVARYPLVNVNTALLERGIRIAIAPGANAGSIDLRFASGDAAAAIARVRIELGPGSRLTLIEQHAEQRPSNSVVELLLAPNACLEHVRVMPESDALHWSLVSVHVDRAADYRLAGYALGGRTRRNDLHVRLDGAQASCEIGLACGSRARDRLDEQVVVEHVAVETQSRQIFHGAATDRGELTFNGRIHIHPGAQRSDARLTNRNLLLDRRARINTKPELEIYANDVKCSHGATVGQFDPAQLFYLRSRGIADETARALLLHGFFADRLTTTAASAGVGALFEALAAA
jgi:Fe-S cluster assembly protein SufD